MVLYNATVKYVNYGCFITKDLTNPSNFVDVAQRLIKIISFTDEFIYLPSYIQEAKFKDFTLLFSFS